MSYDYLLARGDVTGGMEGFAESAAAYTLGPVEPLKIAISQLFPALKWELSTASVPGADGMVSWFGYLGPAEFQLTIEPSGEVRVIGMSHCERAEVEQVARALNLVAFDMQSTEVFGG